MTIDSHSLRLVVASSAVKFLGPSLVYTSSNGVEMNNIIEDCYEDQFAKGQSRRDLRGCLDTKVLETQLMEAIDNVGDFLRFVEISTQMKVTN
jgi:hypothetical protein